MRFGHRRLSNGLAQQVMKISNVDFLKSERPGARFATVAKDCGGKFAKFKKGERVRVWFNGGSSYTIERVKWKGSTVPLAHSCYGIPRSCITIDK